MTLSKYYTYAYLREDGTPYYIGKGSGRRIYVNTGKPCKKPKDKSRIIFLKQNLTEEESFKHEVYMISILGRRDLGTGILHNKSDGGEGSSGAIRSEETRQKISKKLSGENHPWYGKPKTKEFKRKQSERMSGKNNPNYGKKHTEEFKRNRSEERKGKKRPEVSGENHYFYGKKRTEEEKKNLREKLSGENHPNYGKKFPEISERMSGVNHPNAKTFILTDPHGMEYIVTGTLKVFCVEKEINYSTMQTALHRKQTTPRRNGWSIRELNPFFM